MLAMITVPNPILRQPSKPIENVDRKLIQLIKDLELVLVKKTNPPGVGLSAIQIGAPLQIFLTLLPPDPSINIQHSSNKPVLKTYINPRITSASKSITLGDIPDKPLMEGCLSIPRLLGPVWRHQEIKVEYQTLDSTHTSLSTVHELLIGFSARVFQHEFDHLQGILFTDYVLASSPSKIFNPLGKPQPIYFEEEDDFVRIQKPNAILNW